MKRRLALVVLGAWALALVPSAAWAAPEYVSSDPARDAEVKSAPAEVSVVFDLPLDPAASDLGVFACGIQVDDKDVRVLGNRISVGIAEDPKATYTVTWSVQAPAGAAGGNTRGSYGFTVTSGDACGEGDHSHHGGNNNNHNGHGGNNGGNNNNHNGHGGGGGGNHNGHGGGDDHMDGSHSGTSHSGTSHSSGHSSGTHVSAAGTHNGHDMNNGHGGHGNGKKNKNHGDHGDHSDLLDAVRENTNQDPTLAFGDEVPPLPGEAVLVSLLFCALLGAGGGLIVRFSSRL